MALTLRPSDAIPVSLDGYDTDITTIKGGEIGRLFNIPWVYPGSSDKAAADVFDGYAVSSSVKYRSVVSHTLTATASTYRTLFLLDEGTTGYGTLLGTVVGGVAGQNVSGTSVGPHTTTGSGKVTCYFQPGIYAVTLDAVASSLTTSSSVLAGSPLYANTSGQLTLTSSESFDNSSGTPTIVGRFIEFSTNGARVTTNKNNTFTQMVFSFRVEN